MGIKKALANTIMGLAISGFVLGGSSMSANAMGARIDEGFHQVQRVMINDEGEVEVIMDIAAIKRMAREHAALMRKIHEQYRATQAAPLVDSNSGGAEANTAGATGNNEATAKVGYTINEMNSTMYAKSSVNVRNKPSTEGEKVGRLAYGQEITVIGQCEETGWYQIELNGEAAFVSNSYIVAEKPATTAKTNQTAGNTGNQGSGSGQTTGQGTAPETSAKTDDTAVDAQNVSGEFVALLNADRQAMGLSTVTANGTLDSNALESAKAIVVNYSHDAIASTRGGANRANIGQGYGSVADVYAAWKSSPGHWAAMTDAGLKYISVARCGNYWVYLGYAEDVLANYTDANGNVDIGAAAEDGAVNEIGTYTDPNTGQSQTVYGTEGVQTLEDAVASGDVSQEEANEVQDIFDNW